MTTKHCPVCGYKLMTVCNRTPIEKLNLSNRVWNALARRKIRYVEQVIAIDRRELLKLRGFGPAGERELAEKILLFNSLQERKTV